MRNRTRLIGTLYFFYFIYLSMKKLIARIKYFIQTELWQISSKDVSPIQMFFIEIIKKILLAIRFFTTKRVVSAASALTYSTLLAIVPIMAVIFAIARGFGYNKFIEIWFRDALTSQPQVADIIIGFVNSYLVHTKSGIFLGVGLIFMLYTVLMLVRNIEDTFNGIWQVKKKRSIFRTFTDYMAMFLLFPIVIIVMSGLSIFMSDSVNAIPGREVVGPILHFLMEISPYAIMSAIFIGLYVFIPNTHVKVKSAIVPGILAGVSIQLFQQFYINSQMWVSGYNAIYGSFAAFPLFMLWIQISWTICLFGAELCYTNQNLDYYDFDTQTSDISHRYRSMLCSLIHAPICKRFACGHKPYTSAELTQKTGIPIRIVNDLLYKLIEVQLVVEISSDEKGESSRYMPAESIDNITLGTLIDRLESQGRWRLRIPLNDIDKTSWKRALNMRSNYLKEARTILLKDI